MKTPNNISRRMCQNLSDHFGWDKDKHRNVLTIGDKKFSFSITPDNKKPQCRQTYEDTNGFITLHKDALYIYEAETIVGRLSRISPTNIKAYSVCKTLAEMTVFKTYNVL